MQNQKVITEAQALQTIIYDEFLSGETINEIAAKRNLERKTVHSIIEEEIARATSCKVSV